MKFIMFLLDALPALLLVYYVWPITLGLGLGIKNNLDRYLIGFASVQALFFLIYMPSVFFSLSSHALSYLAAIIITVVGLGSAALRLFRFPLKDANLVVCNPNASYCKNPFFIISILIIIYEMYIYVVKEPYIYGDDVTYMRLITDFVDTDAIYTKSWVGQVDSIPISDINPKYLFTSYYPFLGMISILTRMHPLILCKTIIPLIYLPVHYLIVWRIGSLLFNNTPNESKRIEQKSLFLFFYVLLIEFGHISYYTMSRRVSIWIYNSKSDCFTILLPILFVYMYLLFVDKKNSIHILESQNNCYRRFVIMVLALACNSSTLMGIIMSAIIIFVWCIIEAVSERMASFILKNVVLYIPHIIVLILLVLLV